MGASALMTGTCLGDSARSACSVGIVTAGGRHMAGSGWGSPVVVGINSSGTAVLKSGLSLSKMHHTGLFCG